MSDITIAPAPYLKPLPDISDLNRPFWDGLRRHQFLVPRCEDCGDYNWVPYPACRTCLSENQVWTEVSGAAALFTFTVVHRGPGAFGPEVPYVMAYGQLVEQPRRCNVLANVTGIDPGDVRIGLPIKIGYLDIPSEDMTIHQWRPR